MGTKKVKILRSFWNGAGNEMKVGKMEMLPEGIARQAVLAKKAEFVSDDFMEGPSLPGSSSVEDFGAGKESKKAKKD